MATDIDSTYRRIDELVQRDPDAIAFVGGVSDDWIEKAAAALGVEFPPSFIRFLRQYGGGSIGREQIYGLLGVEFEDACGPDIVYNTRFERREFQIPDSYICLLDNDGDEIFYLDTSTESDSGENPVLRVNEEEPDNPEKYYDNFAQYLLKRIEFYFQGLS